MSYNKEELLGIIAKMQQAGESEENIAAVIKEYELKNPRQSGNTTGSSVDATAKPKTAASNQNDTVSQSETGSSDLQNNIAVQDGTRVELPEVKYDPISSIQDVNTFYNATNLDRLKSVTKEDAKIEEDKLKNLTNLGTVSREDVQRATTEAMLGPTPEDVIKKQSFENVEEKQSNLEKAQLSKYVETNFFQNPLVLERITGTQTLQGYSRDGVGIIAGDPLKKEIKSRIGFQSEGRQAFPNVSDSDVDEIIQNTLYKYQDLEKTKASKKRKQLAVDEAQNNGQETASLAFDLELEEMNLHDKDEAELARINKQIRVNGNTPELEARRVELVDQIFYEDEVVFEGGKFGTSKKTGKRVPKYGGGYKRFLDPATGKVIGTDEAKIIKDSGGQVNEITNGYESYMAMFEGTPYGQLEKYNTDVLLEEKGYDLEGDQLMDIEVGDKLLNSRLRDAGYEMQKDGTYKDVPLEFLTNNLPGGLLETLSVKQFLKDFDVKPSKYVEGEYDNPEEFVEFLKNRKEQGLNIAAKKEALWQVYSLNRDYSTIDKTRVGQFFGEAAKLADDVYGRGTAQETFGLTQQQTLDVFESEIMPGMGITDENKKLFTTEDQRNHLQKTLGDNLTLAGGGFARMGLTLAGGNKLQGALGITKIAKNLMGAKYIINGTRMNSSTAVAYAAKKGKSLEKLIETGVATTVKANRIEKAAALGTLAVAEEAKMSGLFNLTSVDGELAFNLGTGSAFLLGSKLVPWKFDNFTKSNRLNTFLDLSLKNGPAFAVAAEVGEVGKALVEDLRGIKEYESFIKENYSDYSQVAHRGVEHVLMGMMLGVHGLGKSKYALKSYKEVGSLRNEAQVNSQRTSKQIEQAFLKHVEKQAREQGVIYKGQSILSTDAPSQQSKRIKKFREENYTQEKLQEFIANQGGGSKVNKLVEDLKNHQQDFYMAQNYLDKANDNDKWKDPVEGKELWEKQHEGLKEFAKSKGKEVQIELTDKPIYQPYVNSKGETKYQEVNALYTRPKTSKDPYKIVYNTRKAKGRGTASHDMLHAYEDIMFEGQPEMAEQYHDQLKKTMQKVELSIDGNKTNLYDAVLGDAAISKMSEPKKFMELRAYTAEYLSKVENQHLIDSRAYSTVGSFVNNMSKSLLGKPLDIFTQKELVNMLGRYGSTGKLSELKHLDKYLEIGKKPTEAELASRDLLAEKQQLIDTNIELAKTKPEGYMDLAKKNSDKIKQINKNIEISARNEKNIKRFKEGEPGDRLREAAGNQLVADNMPIIESFFNRKFKRGLDVSETDFRGSMMEQVARIMNSYDIKSGVPFGAYLKTRLEPQLGNILKRVQGGRTTEIAMSEAGVDAETLQVADMSPELGRSGSGPEAPKGRDLTKDLNIPESVVESAQQKLESLDPTTLTYKTLKDLAPEFTNELLGVEPKAGNLGKQSVANAQKWFSNSSNARLFIDALPEGTVPMEGAPEAVKGTATGVQTTLLKDFYNKGARAKTKAGAAVQIKRKDITPQQIKDYFGIKPDGTFVELKNDRSLSQKVKAAVDQLGKAWSNQVARDYLKNNSTQYNLGESIQNTINRIAAGKSESLASKELGKQSRETQEKLFESVATPEFGKILNANISAYGENNKAVSEAFREYFKDKDIDLVLTGATGKPKTKNAVLKTMADQLSKSLKLEGFTWDNIALKIGNNIASPNEYSAVETRNGLRQLSNPFGTKEGIVKGREAEFLLANHFNKKYGNGFAEAFFKAGATTGSGLGPFKSSEVDAGPGGSIHNIKFGTPFGGTRPSYFVTANDYKLNVSDVIAKKNNKNWEGKKPSTYVTDRAKLMDKWVNGTLDPMEAYNIGEQNKNVLREAIEVLNEAYEAGEINHEHVRAFTQLHSASMPGLIKSSASLALLPKGNPKDFIKKYGQGGKTFSKWVLEHTTPAKEISTLIYDYITAAEPARKTQLKGWVKNALDNYHTTLIPEVLDATVNQIYKEKLPPETLFDGKSDVITDRYHANAFGEAFDIPLENFITGKVYEKLPGASTVELQRKSQRLRDYQNAIFPKGYKEALASKDLNQAVKDINEAILKGRLKNKPVRGGSVFDFDETLIIDGENFVVAKKGKEKIKISSGNWPIEGPKYAEQGYIFDFSDFVNVRGGKDGPLLQKMKNQIKKYGPDNMFVLTARMQEAAGPIHQWLKTKGINIPLENITGLGKSQGEAKAMWMLEKAAQGYNDLYFVDDALPNVEAVKKVLDQIDIKSNVQQALASRDLNAGVNDIMKHSLGIDAKTIVSKPEAKTLGAGIKRRRIFMTDGAADLELLIEPLYGKGKKGVKNKQWFQDNFIRTWERNYNDYNTARHRTLNEYYTLRKNQKETVKKLGEKAGDTNLTNDAAIRVYLWNKAGVKVPDLPAELQTKLVDHVRSNPDLVSYAENVKKITGLETGVKEPTDTWWSDSIASEMGEMGGQTGRNRYIGEWIEVKNEIFSEDNLNKMESKLGSNWRQNMEDMLDRMETGRSRKLNLGKEGNAIMNYLNGSVGTIMNLNTRSAVLQTISNVNFINHSFNNPLAATRAFANQKQYWKDFMTIMNSDMLVNRRAGLEINVTEAELAQAAANSKNPASAALAKILKAGFLPTKVMDSFAIASGGATYYRNAIRKYTKEGLSKAEAERKAFIDFQAIAERTQQSSRPDLLSQQQTSFAGRLILPFANTPMQMNRIMMKSLLDLKNGRYEGSFGDNSISNHMSKVAYYGAVQSMIFAYLQSGALALMTNSDDDELTSEKKLNAVNTMSDSFLRGMGIEGAVVSGLKNAVLEFKNQNEKGFGADFSEVGEDLLNISPTIGSKFTKLDAAGNTYKYNKKQIQKEGLTLTGPLLEMATQYTEAILNVPANRVYKKVSNISEALNDQNEAWQRVMVGLGWSQWDVGIGQRKLQDKKDEKERIKQEEKEQERIQKEKDKKAREEARKNRKDGDDLDGDGKKEYRCRAITKAGKRCKNITENKSKKCYAHM